MGMVRPTDYKDRFAEAMRLSKMSDVQKLADEIGITYQAVMKVLNGTSKMLKADNNVIAARVMAVDSEWLATGEGQARGPKTWPFSQELLGAVRAAEEADLRRAENAARNALDLDALPRLGEGGTKTANRRPPKAG